MLNISEKNYGNLSPSHIMKPIFDVNKIKALKPCKKCGFIQYRMKEYENDNGEPYYYISKEVLEDLHDINRLCRLV